jgi:hypothetical protein
MEAICFGSYQYLSDSATILYYLSCFGSGLCFVDGTTSYTSCFFLLGIGSERYMSAQNRIVFSTFLSM